MCHTDIGNTRADADSHLGSGQECSSRVIGYLNLPSGPLLDLVAECLSEYRVLVYYRKIISKFELDRFCPIA